MTDPAIRSLIHPGERRQSRGSYRFVGDSLGTAHHHRDIGAASDLHAGGTPGEDKSYHRFHR